MDPGVLGRDHDPDLVAVLAGRTIQDMTGTLATQGRARRIHVSPSQVATWRACQRKWAYSRIRPRTENRYAAFGSRAHTIAENWLISRTPPDPTTAEGACILAGLDSLPQPGTAAVELRLDAMHEGIHYTGRIDFLYQSGPRLIVVGDHKTTGDLTWAKTPTDLEDDPQRVVYSWWAGQTFAADWIGAHWQYYQRKPPRSLPVYMQEPVARIRERFQELHERDGKAIVAANGLDPKELPRSLDHCDAFGGCPYRAECHAGVSPISRVAGLLSR